MAKYSVAELERMLSEAKAKEGKYTDLREKIDALCEKQGTTLADVLKATGNPATTTLKPKYRFEGVAWTGQGAFTPVKWSLFDLKTDKGKLGIYHKGKLISAKEAKTILEKGGHLIGDDGLTDAERKAKGKPTAVIVE